MIGLPFWSKRKGAKAADLAPAKPLPAPPAQNREKPWRFQGGMPERTQDLLGRQDGERVGFRKPVQG